MSGRLAVALSAGLALLGLAPAARAATPVATGETVVVAQTTAKATLYVPTRTTVTATVAGTGRLVGVILRERHAHPDEVSFLRVRGSAYASGNEVRKGFYDVYVVTDGHPVRATLRFARLNGSSSVTASRAVASRTVPFTTSVGAPVSWSAGAGVTTNGPAYLFSLAWWQQDESAVAGSGGCWYDGSDGIEELGDYRWLPGCPLGMSGGFNEVRNPAGPPGPSVRSGTHVSFGQSSTTAAGEYGLGMWVNAQNVRNADGFAMWVGR